jgi:hypothetical protein
MTTEAYELPPMNPVPAMSLDQFRSGELAVSTQACRNYAALYGQECARLAVKQERERAAKVPESLNRPDELRLRLGEMTAQEMRSVQAALRLVAAAIRAG